VKLYRLLLYCYPKSFRADYGREMDAVFAREARGARGPARIRLWLRALADVLSNAPSAHWDILKQDLRYSMRTIARMPMFSVTVVLVAAIGIGATTTAFSLADHVLVRPLPFREPDRLVKLWQDPGSRGSRLELSPANYEDWKAQGTSFAGMAAFNVFTANVTEHGEPVRLDGTRVTGDLFDVLGTRPAVGRFITRDDDRPGATRTVVLSARLWRVRFGADPNILGRTITLDDSPYVIVGVAPATFEFPIRTVDFWIPFQFGPPNFQDRGDTYLQVIGRLRNGASLDQARAEIRAAAQDIERRYPITNTGIGANLLWLRDEISQQSRMLLIGLVAASVAVLLIACTNLANLFLTRGLSRQRELAVRAALGAGRERLVRQMFTESLVLAGLGGVFGLALGMSVVPFAARLVPTTLPIAETPDVDSRMLMAAAIATLATAIGFGVIPALRIGRHADAAALREGGRTGTGRRTRRLRSALVVSEVTLSMVLIVCAGLLVRALWKVQDVDPGFKSDGVLTLRTALPLPKYTATVRKHQFYDPVLEGVRALPGVSHAAYISFLPMVMRGGIFGVTVDGKPDEPGARTAVSLREVTPGFFDTLGIPIRRGRDISDADRPGSPRVAIVSESFARQQWPTVDPIGRHLSIGRLFRDLVVVGVVGDIRVRGLERASEPQVYISSRQVPDGNIMFYAPKDLVIKSSVAASTLLPAIRQIIARADPQQPISDIQTLGDIVAADTAPRSAQARVLASFAAIAFLLAVLGLHGLLSFNISAQSRDIGVRMALGADKFEILRMVLRYGLALAATGMALGTVLAVAAGRTMQALLAGVSPADAATLVGGVATSLLLALAGSLAPALRAMRVDPIAVIRTE